NMSKQHIANYFKKIQDKEKQLFIPHIMPGDEELDILNYRIHFLKHAGAAAVELNIPLSDPVAAGKTIHQSAIHALNDDVSLKKVLDTIAPTKQNRDIPIILMTYINPIFCYGVETFAADCAASGVSGIIIPDIPMEEEALIADALYNHDIAF